MACAGQSVKFTHNGVAVDREAFNQDGDEQVKQYVVAERHQRDEVQCRPLRRHRHAVVKHLLPVLLSQNLSTVASVTSGSSNWRPAGRIRPARQVDPAREAKLNFCNIVEMLTIIQ